MKFTENNERESSWEKFYTEENLETIKRHYAKKKAFLVPSYINSNKMSKAFPAPNPAVLVTRSLLPNYLPGFEHFYLKSDEIKHEIANEFEKS